MELLMLLVVVILLLALKSIKKYANEDDTLALASSEAGKKSRMVLIPVILIASIVAIYSYSGENGIAHTPLGIAVIVFIALALILKAVIQKTRSSYAIL